MSQDNHRPVSHVDHPKISGPCAGSGLIQYIPINFDIVLFVFIKKGCG